MIDLHIHTIASSDGQHTPREIFAMARRLELCAISFADHNSRESVEQFRNKMIYAQSDDKIISLPDGEYFHHDLLGMKVLSIDHEEIGRLVDIIQTGANDVYVIRPESEEKKEILIPAIKSVVIEIDCENKIMLIKLQEWF